MSILLTDDEILRVGLLDLIAKNWPDLVENWCPHLAEKWQTPVTGPGAILRGVAGADRIRPRRLLDIAIERAYASWHGTISTESAGRRNY